MWRKPSVWIADLRYEIRTRDLLNTKLSANHSAARTGALLSNDMYSDNDVFRNDWFYVQVINVRSIELPKQQVNTSENFVLQCSTVILYSLMRLEVLTIYNNFA